MAELPPGFKLEELPEGFVLEGAKERTFRDTIDHTLETAAAIPDLALTVASAGVGEVLGGLTGLANLAITRDPDEAARRVNEVSDFITVGPLTSGGKKALEEVGPALAVLDESATDFAEQLANSPSPFGPHGNPVETATVIKTALLGGLELVPAGKPGVSMAKTARNLKAKQKEVLKIAEDNGIRLSLDEFGDSVIEAAQRQASDRRGVNTPLVAEALAQQRKIDTDRRAALFDEARSSNTFVETRPVRELGGVSEKSLVDRGFDLGAENMAPVRRTLQELAGPEFGFAPGQNLAVNLNMLEMVRRRINKRLGSDRQVNTALNSIKKDIDRFLDNEFNLAAIEAGQIKPGSSALSGEARGLDAWKRARAANVEWHKRFSEDKVISWLIDRDATPTEMRQWIMGASAMGAKKPAANTVMRMREILGDNHPAIEGLRQDFIFELVEPLLKDQPGFKQFINTYDTTIRRNPDLVEALQLDKTALNDLRDLARVQIDLPPGGVIFNDLKDVIRNVSRLAVGHGIAKAGVRVQLTSRIGNYLAGTDVMGPKAILEDIMKVKFNEPAIPKNSPAATTFRTGAALSGAGLVELGEDEE